MLEQFFFSRLLPLIEQQHDTINKVFECCVGSQGDLGVDSSLTEVGGWQPPHPLTPPTTRCSTQDSSQHLRLAVATDPWCQRRTRLICYGVYTHGVGTGTTPSGKCKDHSELRMDGLTVIIFSDGVLHQVYHAMYLIYCMSMRCYIQFRVFFLSFPIFRQR